ncbi:hypothetical protein [Microbacterium dextranolyticum]|uniref:Uncharacterized protein n=1 Tax=Microbacterium dextranolyticum TaxID=36806 RepID=A0A9W6HKH2_9MICO|nr:hypothetical protein [Microbacterium dextranolyticum]MBM7461833.1 hypothetical protein [Microbacterium dextranolyticum]GLJ94074.1 hypothetical protein GCM10017591_01350 [Microbacterium dextranolyticum]
MTMAPIGGDVAGIREHASRYRSTARAVSDAVEMLQAVIDASESETSEAVDALAGTIGDTKTFLSRIRERYEVAGSALTTFASELEHAQQQAESAILAHGAAQLRHSYAQRNLTEAREASRQTVDPDELAEATDAARRYSSMSATATTDLAQAESAYAAAVERVQRAGDAAASTISQTVSSDELNDSVWDNVLDWVHQNAGWLKVVKDILTVVTAIVGVLSIFFPVLAPIALGLAVVSMGLSFLLASSGDGSWFDFALDAIGVLTFGVGTAALAGIKLGTVALRGGRAATLAVRSPGMVWGNGARQVVGNLLDRGLVGSLRQPMRMVAEESAGVLRARPNFAQVVTHWGDDAIKGIRKSDSIIISEFDQIASQARLGAGGAIDDLVTSGVDGLKGVVGTMGKIGSAIDGYNMVGIGIGRGNDFIHWAEDQTGVPTPLSTLTTGLNEVYGAIPGLFEAPMGADWRSPSAP